MALTTVTSLAETFVSTVGTTHEHAGMDAEKALTAQMNGVDLGKGAEDKIVDSETTASPAVASSVEVANEAAQAAEAAA